MSNPLRRARNAPPPNSHSTPSRMEEARRKIKGEPTGEYTNRDIRGHFIAMSGEFVGTVLFLWFAFAATQIAVNQQTADPLVKLLFISMAFGFSLATTAWVFYRVSGGLFNPAVSYPQLSRIFSFLVLIERLTHPPAGDRRYDDCRSITMGPRSTLDPNSATWRYCRRRSCQLHVPWRTLVCHKLDTGHLHCSRSLHRNVFNR